MHRQAPEATGRKNPQRILMRQVFHGTFPPYHTGEITKTAGERRKKGGTVKRRGKERVQERQMRRELKQSER